MKFSYQGRFTAPPACICAANLKRVKSSSPRATASVQKLIFSLEPSSGLVFSR